MNKPGQSNRLEQGGRIDRSRPLDFRFNGKSYQGFHGDTLASALLANGVKLVGRSFKLHRPRGIVGAGAEEPNAIMQIGQGALTEPNPRATQVQLEQGLTAKSTKGWPGLGFDIGEINDVLSRLFTAGFYYKTFMYPRKLWGAYERFIRNSAGFGTAPIEADPESYEHINAHCDVLVVGAGPAGLMAALAAARSGARVILADDQSEAGGRLLSGNELIGGQTAQHWVDKLVTELAETPDVKVLRQATVYGYHDHNFLTIAQGLCQWRVRARQVVLAQGAFERPLVFCNNDRPGVMLASAISTYIHRYAVRPGQVAVVFTNNDSAYQTALDMVSAGISLAAIIDSRESGHNSYIVRAAEEAGIPLIFGHVVCDVIGSRCVRAVKVAQWQGGVNSEQKTDETLHSNITIECDLLAMSGGWSPAVHLHSHAGGKNSWDKEHHCFIPEPSDRPNISVGAGRAVWNLRSCLEDGLRAGQEVARLCGFEPVKFVAPDVETHAQNPLQPLWRVPGEQDADRCAKQFLDFQNDTCVADIRQAVREGYQNVEHVKRYTALGFGTDQGKLGNINGMAVLAMALNEPIENIGTTTFRPAYTPTRFGVIAGESVNALYEPVRTTAIHSWHETAGAPMETVGQWHRPWYFPQNVETLDEAVARECLATRASVGVMDASTLGKIDVQGPDALTFLNRIYTHDVGKMKIGRCAYGITLGEDGMVKDDGVMARLGEQHFYLTTTTGGAASAMAWLEIWLQTEWPELDVHLTSLTDHFSTIAVVGPNSRRVLQKMNCDVSLDKEHFSFMQVKNARLSGLPVQLFRVSFSGELAFEINIDSRYALKMWHKVMQVGEEFNITPYGTEAMHVLRAEKGFVIVGQDTDGSVIPEDLKMNWLLAKNKDFLGKRSLKRADSMRSNRKQLVGLMSVDGKTVLREGAQLIQNPNAEKPVPMLGHVTSAYYSACLGYPIAMALLEGGHKRSGDNLFACNSDGSSVEVKVVSSVFYDAKGERQNV